MSRTPLDRRTFFKLTGLVLGGATVLTACGGDDATATGSTGTSSAGAGTGPADFGALAVQLSWIKNVEFAGSYFAESKGYSKEAGLSAVELMAGGAAGTGAEAALVTGRAQIGISSPLLTAPAILEGAAIKTIGTTFQKNPFCILSLAAAPIADPAAMRGKRIGVQDTNDLVWSALLKANGIEESELTRVPVQFDPSPLTAGDVDGFLAFITNEPITLMTRGQEVTTFLFAEHGLPTVSETFIATDADIKDDREKLKAFLVAEIKGWKDAIADPEEAARLSAEVYGKDLKLDQAEQVLQAKGQAELIQSADTKANGLFTMTDELVEANIKSLSLAGITITAEQLFDLSLLQEVYEENPDLKTA